MSERTINQIRSTSRFISLILRHKPETIGITLDEHGWADVKNLISGINKTGNHFLDMELLVTLLSIGAAAIFLNCV